MKTLVGLDIVGPISNIIQVSCCNKVSFSFRHSKSYWKNVLIVSSNQNIISDYWQKREQQFIFSTYIKSKKKKKKNSGSDIQNLLEKKKLPFIVPLLMVTHT